MDEPKFELRAQDKLAPGIVEEWARVLKAYGGSEEKVQGAVQIAKDMRRWQADHPDEVKLPD